MKINGLSSIAEPDDFAIGTDLTHAFEGITLSVEGHPEKHVVVADGFSTFLGENFASTGTHVFATDPPQPNEPHSFDEEFGTLRIDFEHGTDFVQIDLGADDDDIGALRAYNANGQLIDSVQVGSTEFREQYAHPSISFADAQIAYVTVGGVHSEGMWLDNLHFGVVGTSGSDTMTGTNLDDHYNGLGGNDTINGKDGSDTLHGGDGADRLDGGLGVDWLYGDGGNDTIYFGGYADHYDGGPGFDTLSFAKKTAGWSLGEIDSPDMHDIEDHGGSWGGFEKVVGSPYADSFNLDIGVIDGAGGNDFLSLYGGGGGKIYGGAGNDTITFNGQEGVGDLIGYGGSGNDKLSVHDMTGGSGKDTFILDYSFGEVVPSNNGGAIVRDFTHGYDHISFQGENPGALTHSGDIWTVHSVDDSGNTYNTSFEIAGVTHLSSSEYDFHLG
jgi:Ca2+-binding RTX toxin-like protein